MNKYDKTKIVYQKTADATSVTAIGFNAFRHEKLLLWNKRSHLAQLPTPQPSHFDLNYVWIIFPCMAKKEFKFTTMFYY